MANKNTPKIEVDEVNLEDLIILGDSKLIDIKITYPKDDGTESVSKAKIKQLTMEELKNINLKNIDLEATARILQKCLFKNDGTHFSKEMIYHLPVGVASAISEEILKLSGVDLKKEY